MSAHNDNDFDRLLAAHCNRDLDRAELEQLQDMARGDDSRAREVREVDAVHRALDFERELQAVAVAPLEPREEADPVYQKLCRVAAEAEQEIRALGRPPAPMVMPRARMLTMRRAVGAAAAAVLVFAIAFATGVFGPSEPADLRLRGVPQIFLKKEIGMQSREISWYEVVGARSY